MLYGTFGVILKNWMRLENGDELFKSEASHTSDI